MATDISGYDSERGRDPTTQDSAGNGSAVGAGTGVLGRTLAPKLLGTGGRNQYIGKKDPAYAHIQTTSANDGTAANLKQARMTGAIDFANPMVNAAAAGTPLPADVTAAMRQNGPSGTKLAGNPSAAAPPPPTTNIDWGAGLPGVEQYFNDFRPGTGLKGVDDTTFSGVSDGRDAQKRLLALLEAASQGKGPSAAQDQLQAGTDANIRAALAQAASARGGSQAAASRSAISAAGIAGQQQANQAAQLRAQEMNAAYGLTAQVSGQLRGQDQEIALANMQKQLTLSVEQGKISSGEATAIYKANADAAMATAKLRADLNVAKGQGQITMRGQDSDTAFKDKQLAQQGVISLEELAIKREANRIAARSGANKGIADAAGAASSVTGILSGLGVFGGNGGGDQGGTDFGGTFDPYADSPGGGDGGQSTGSAGDWQFGAGTQSYGSPEGFGLTQNASQPRSTTQVSQQLSSNFRTRKKR